MPSDDLSGSAVGPKVPTSASYNMRMQHVPSPAVLLGPIKKLLLHQAAKKFEGSWEAFEMPGRDPVYKMENAFLTTITVKAWWPFEPRVLDVVGHDWDADGRTTRPHHGHIVIDPVIRSQAIRTIIYEGSGEIAHQRIQFGDSPNILYVMPLEPGYGKHALRRTYRRLDY